MEPSERRLLFDFVSSIIRHQPTEAPVELCGGCIHRTFRWGDYFIKANSNHHDLAFRREAEGLRAISSTGSIRTPEVVGTGSSDEHAVIILEYLPLQSHGDEKRLGEALADLHSHTQADYGFPENNFIGSTPQRNESQPSWPAFFAQCRLLIMFELLEHKGITFPRRQILLDRLDEILPPNPPASLLHGDLWNGNRAFLEDGTPVLFDPACYHGHAACDLAMTRLFGGFGEAFYQAYEGCASERMKAPHLHELYNLYHVLNHVLLFGGSYVEEARQTILRLT